MQKLKILFICGSLEPGKDGVGDYTRRFASELIDLKHQCVIIAINDKHLEVSWQGYQKVEVNNIKVFRLSAQASSKTRLASVKNEIEAFNPDFLSIQFVPFSFQKKGLPFFLGKQLKRISKNRKWHVMFHELFIGMDTEAPLKYRLWGMAQKYIINSFLKTLRPQVIHTQTRLYQYLLIRGGANAKYLPLFGNIPLKKFNLKVNNNNANPKSISLVIFGNIYYGTPVKAFAHEAAVYALQSNCQIVLTLIGRNGSEAETWVKEWERTNLVVNKLGEQTEEIISQILYEADFGISTTPLLLAEKSGTIAAMQEHGLPIIIVSRNWDVNFRFDFTLSNSLHQYQENNLKAIFENRNYTVDRNSVQSVTKQFVNDLQTWQV